MRPNEVTELIIGAAVRVHRELGAGMLEKTIDVCLVHEFLETGLVFKHQEPLPVIYKQVRLPMAYRVDFIVEDCVIVEVKCVERLLPVHSAQLLSYLRLTGLKLGLLINFNVPRLTDGIRRIINGPASEL